MLPPAAPGPSSVHPSNLHLAPSRRTNTSVASSGSQTVTATNTPSPEPELILRLRGAHDPSTQSQRRIQWAEGTIDNEGLGRKKSKVCCIYHKEHPVGESSDESSSDSDDSNDGRGDRAKPVGGRGRKGRGNDHDHEGCEHGHGHEHGKKGKGKRKPSPNAYEKMPKYDIKSLKAMDKAGV